MNTPRLILGIPGPWATLPDVARAVTASGSGYELEGNRFRAVGSCTTFDVELYDHDPNLRRAFEIAGEGRFTPAELSGIENHRSTVYLLGIGGSAENAWAAARAAVGLLDSGGLAVKIESTGKAHTSSYWRESASSNDLFRLYSTFVVLVGARECFYSCGMHNLGFPDASIDSRLGTDAGARVLNNFNYYQLSKRPILKSGHTLQIAAGEPVFRITLDVCKRFADEHPFHNPYGVWNITRMGDD